MILSDLCTGVHRGIPRILTRIHRRVGLCWLTFLGALVFAACSTAPPVGGPESGRAGLLVIHGDGQVFSTCVSFSGATITGAELLERSGLEIITDLTNPMGVLVCSIDGEGCSYPKEKCLCECEGIGSCTYWAYFTLGQDGQWAYSPQGAAARRVADGDVDAWIWMESASAQEVGIPGLPDVRFDEICGK